MMLRYLNTYTISTLKENMFNQVFDNNMISGFLVVAIFSPVILFSTLYISNHHSFIQKRLTIRKKIRKKYSSEEIILLGKSNLSNLGLSLSKVFVANTTLPS